MIADERGRFPGWGLNDGALETRGETEVLHRRQKVPLLKLAGQQRTEREAELPFPLLPLGVARGAHCAPPMGVPSPHGTSSLWGQGDIPTCSHSTPSRPHCHSKTLAFLPKWPLAQQVQAFPPGVHPRPS